MFMIRTSNNSFSLLFAPENSLTSEPQYALVTLLRIRAEKPKEIGNSDDSDDALG